MKTQNLTQYVFADGHEQIADQKGRIIAVRDPEVSEEYLPWREIFAPRVQGSAPSLDSLVGFSDVPKVGEHLVTFRGVLIFGRQYISDSRIREIIEDCSVQI